LGDVGFDRFTNNVRSDLCFIITPNPVPSQQVFYEPENFKVKLDGFFPAI
jgi:hypothetical protein